MVLELGYFIDFDGNGTQDPLSVDLSMTAAEKEDEKQEVVDEVFKKDDDLEKIKDEYDVEEVEKPRIWQDEIEKRKKRSKNYYLKNQEKIKARQRERYLQNRCKQKIAQKNNKEYHKQYYLEHKDKFKNTYVRKRRGYYVYKDTEEYLFHTIKEACVFLNCSYIKFRKMLDSDIDINGWEAEEAI